MLEKHASRRALQSSTLMLLVLGLVVCCVLGWLIYKNSTTQRFDNILLEQQRHINQAQLFFGQQIGGINHTIKLLHSSPALQHALGSDQVIGKHLMNELFVSYIRSLDSLMQVRWIDEQGIEQARVDAYSGVVNIVPESGLQDKSDRYYVKQGLKSHDKKVYLTDIDLNIENGKLEVPYRPTIRAILKTGGVDQLHTGLLALNYDIGQLLNSIQTLDTAEVNLQIVDQNGYWVLNSNRELEWGRDLHQPENTIAVIEPEVWTYIQNKSEREAISVPLGLISYKCTNLTGTYLRENVVDGPSVCFIAVTPRSISDKVKWKAAVSAISISSLFFFFGVLVLIREWRASMTLIHLNRRLDKDKKLLESTAEYTQDLLNQQQLLQDDLVESRKLSALGMMVAGVAHELNTPIGAAILASSKLRSEQRELSALIKEGLTKNALLNYLDSSGRGLDLVEQNQLRAAELIRSFKRLAIDRVREEVVPFNLNQVIRDLIRTLHHRLAVSHVEVHIDIDDIEMRGNPGVISQVIQNLIINAIQHAFDPNIGGTLVVSGKLCSDEDTVELMVSDDGAGVHPDILSSMFDPFVTSKRIKGNTGLGMHFVYQWVTNSLNGTISVDSEQTKGTCFTIIIPRWSQDNLPED